VSSEDECSAGEDSADCFCSDTGHSEPCTQHQPHNFSCLGKHCFTQCWFLICMWGKRVYFGMGGLGS
jgi:hypothetical protein